VEEPDVDLEKECRNCLHRKTGLVCKNAQSSHFEQRISFDDTCGYFVPSQAQAHYVRALSTTFLMLKAQTLAEKEQDMHAVVDNFTAAIAVGLPSEDEVTARIGTATACADVVAHRIKAGEDTSRLESEEMQRVLVEINKAGALERKLDMNEVAGIWYQLANVDLLIDLKAAVVQRDESIESSERFVRQQLEAFDHIVPTPLPRTLLRLGKYLGHQGKYSAAADCFQNVLNSLSRKEAAFLKNTDKLKQQAKSLLEEASADKIEVDASKEAAVGRKVNAKINSTPEKSGCFIATAVYGSSLAPDVFLLKRYRDKVLLRSPAGRAFVTFYYRVSPPFANLIACSQSLRILVRLIVIAPGLQLAKRSLRMKPEEPASLKN